MQEKPHTIFLNVACIDRKQLVLNKSAEDEGILPITREECS